MSVKRLLLLAAQHAPCIDNHQFEMAEKIEKEFEAALNEMVRTIVQRELKPCQSSAEYWAQFSPGRQNAQLGEPPRLLGDPVPLLGDPAPRSGTL